MKKLFIGLFTASIMLFMSSCVVVADKPAVVVVEPLFYSITFVNDTEENVIDWYVHTAFKKGHWSVEKGTIGAQKRTA